MSYLGMQGYVALVSINGVYLISWLLYYYYNFFLLFLDGGIVVLQLICGILTQKARNWNNAPVFDEEVSKTEIHMIIFIGVNLVFIGGLLAFVFSLK